MGIMNIANNKEKRMKYGKVFIMKDCETKQQI